MQKRLTIKICDPNKNGNMFCKARKSDSQNAQMVKKMLEKKRRAMKTILNLTIKQLYNSVF